MYDTSDIRKGLKIMIDGSPYTVVEFQFVKPGKGAAFTRTKMKNLLTGGVLERNLRSGERLEPADVETKTMQYLYADADSFVFMDTTTYDQVQITRDTVGDQASPLLEGADCAGKILVVDVTGFDGRCHQVARGLQQGADGAYGDSPVAEAVKRIGLVRHTCPSGVEPSRTAARMEPICKGKAAGSPFAGCSPPFRAPRD